MIAALVFYIISLGVTIYDKYCVMLDRWEKPDLYRRPVFFVVFSIGKLALLVAYFALFWAFSSLYVALGAIVLHFIVGSIVLRKFFRKRVAIWYPHMLNAVRRDQPEGASLSETEIEQQALALAESAARKAMRNEQ